MTAITECMQGFANRLPSLTMCEYDVDCEPIADLRTDPARANHGIGLGDLDGPWLTAQLAGKQAASWRAADRLKAQGHCGALVPSFAPGATAINVNLVLWQWGPDLPQRVDVFDPSGRLPRNQLSWR